MEAPSDRLRAKLDLAFPVLNVFANRLWHSPNVREIYPLYLGTMNMIVRSAVPLIEAARQQASALSATDNVAAGLVQYLSHHASEERGHDRWLLEDLEAIGGDVDGLLERIPPPSVATLVGAQYYWLHHYHPVALLGHMAAIEGYHPPAGFAARLQSLTGYPREGFRSISRHERLDIRHKQDIYDLIDSLPLASRHEKLMAISGLHTMSGVIEVLDEMTTTSVHPESSPAAAHRHSASTA